MPRFNGNEFSAEQILRRGECDVVLLGPTSEAELGRLSKEANATLSRVATIELTSSKRLVSNAKVSIHVAAPGIDASGDFCRLDDVALPLTGLISTERPAAEEVLRQLIPSPAAD
jgi:formylmethanofuran dehydrogenase subunit B